MPTRASHSSGMRANAAGPSWSSRVGATRTAQTTAPATSAVASRRARRERGPAPVRYSQPTLCANDSASRTRAAPTTIMPTSRGSSPETAAVRATPWTAATTLPQYRGGSGAASQGTTHPAISST
jgi:hypothetical protein